MEHLHLITLWRYLTSDPDILNFLKLTTTSTDVDKMKRFALEQDLDTALTAQSIPLMKMYPDDGMVTTYLQEKEFFIIECYHGSLRQAIQGMDLVKNLIDNQFLPGYPKGWEITLRWPGAPISTGVTGIKGFRAKFSQLVQK